MRSFDDGASLIDRVPADIVRRLADVDQGRGLERLHVAQLPGLLDRLAARARVQSITASSALEGVVVPDEGRAGRIIGGSATTLRTRSEQELAGYRDALDYVWQQDFHPVSTGLVLHLHRLLLAHTVTPGGTLKSEDNLVVDRLPDGGHSMRFRPVSARETPTYLPELFARLQVERDADHHHPLLLVGLAILDLLVIHPFADGNGRVARILTNALLCDVGYGVARYVSLEQLVAESADAYYRTLLASTQGWHEGAHDPWPWLGYLVEQAARAYASYQDSSRAATSGGSKRDRVKRYVLDQAPRVFSISDIRTAVLGVGDGTIRNALDDLRAEGAVEVDGPGRAARWTRLEG